jgi:transcriptional regulator with XRE-family HTH domain
MIEPAAYCSWRNFHEMNFTQMHERLRLELLRRIRRGTLSVSLLARQTGFGQSHISNFLRSRRQLSLEGLDRVLVAQHITALDLLPADYHRSDETDAVPLVSHAGALFEPRIRRSAERGTIHIPSAVVIAARTRVSPSRQKWDRFVAISISTEDAQPMEPVVQPEAIVVVDRHYISLVDCRPDRNNIYAVRNGSRLLLRYADFLANRLVLRPHNLAFPVDLLEIPPGETPADMIAGRVALILNEV